MTQACKPRDIALRLQSSWPLVVHRVARGVHPKLIVSRRVQLPTREKAGGDGDLSGACYKAPAALRT